MPRSVGSIEITVDADTGKLVAQMRRAGKVAGEVSAEAMEKELSNIKAKIKKVDTSEAAREAQAAIKLLRKRIEAQLKGIDLGLDTRQALATLRAFEAHAEATELALNVRLSERDLAEINAQIRAMSAKTEAAQIQFEADLDQANLNVQKFIATQRDAKIQFEADLDQININLAKFRAERHEAQIRLVIEDQRARAALAAFEYAAERRELGIPILADLDSFNRSIQETRARLKFASVDISVAADMKKAAASVEALYAGIENRTLNLKTEADIAKARATIAAFREFQENNDIDIPVNADLDALDAALAHVEAQLVAGMGAAGQRAGASFGDGGGRGLSTRMKAIIGGIILLMEPAAVALQGLASMASSVLSSAFSALGGAVGALAPILAGVAASVATLIVGFQGMGTALGAVSEEFAASLVEGRAFSMNTKEIRAAMATLAPAARDVVTAFADLQPQLSAIRQLVQQNLFQGLGDSLRSLGSDVLPQIGAGLAGLSRSFNAFFKGLAADAQGIDFAGIFADLRPIVDSLLDAFRSLFRTIEPFLKAAAPAAQLLADSFKDSAASIEDMVNAGAKSGNLTKFLVEGVESLKEWGRLLKASGDALFTFFEAGKGQGDSFISQLTAMITRWDDWMESVEGQKALQEFFATGARLAEDLKPVLQGLKGFFENLISPGAVSRFGDFAESVGRILPTLGSLFEIIGRMEILNTFAGLLAAIAEAIDPIVPRLQEMASSVGVALNSALLASIPLIELAAEALGAIADIVGTVADAFVALPGPIQTVVVALGLLVLLRDKIGGLGQTFIKLRDNIILLKPAFQDVGSAIHTTFSKGIDLTQIQTGMKQLGPALIQAGKSAASAAGVATAGALGIAFGAQMASQADDMAGKVTGVMSIIAGSMTGFAAGPLVGSVTVGLGIIGAAFQANAQDAKDAAAEVAEYETALSGLDKAANKIKLVETVMANLRDEQETTRKSFADLGFVVEDWAVGLADGTETAKSGFADLAATAGPVGQKIAAGVRAGTISFEDMERAIDDNKGNLDQLEGPARDLVAAFEAMGISGETVREMLDFITDEAREHGEAVEEIALQDREAGDALKGLGEDAAGVAGVMPTVTDAMLTVAEAEALMIERLEEARDLLILQEEAARNNATGWALVDSSMAGVIDASHEAEGGLSELTDEAKDAEQAIKDLETQIELFFSPALAAENAARGYAEALDELGKVFTGGETAEKERAKAAEAQADLDAIRVNNTNELTDSERARIKTLNDTIWYSTAAADAAEEQARGLSNLTEGGREASETLEAFAAAAHTNATEIGAATGSQAQFALSLAGAAAEMANAGRAAGKSEPEIAAVLDRFALGVEPIVLEFVTAEVDAANAALLQVDENVNGIPDSIDLILSLPGISEVQRQLLLADENADGIPDSVQIDMGVDGAVQTQQTLGDFTEMVVGLDGMMVTPEVRLQQETFAAEMHNVNYSLDALDQTSVDPETGLVTTSFDTSMGAVIEDITGLEQATPTPVVDLDKSAFDTSMGDVVEAVAGVNEQKATVDTEVINNFIVMVQLAAIKDLVTEIDEIEAKPGITLPNYPTLVLQLAALQTGMRTLDLMVADPRIVLPTYMTVILQIAAISVGLRDLPDGTANVTVTGVQTGIDKVNELYRAIDRLQSKTITVTTKNVTTGGSMTGSIVPGGQTGALVRSPRLMEVGERGYDEAIIPLQLPLNRVDPSVRELAAILRGELPVPKAGPTKILNQYMTVNAVSADPVAVATQVVNRSAMLAH